MLPRDERIGTSDFRRAFENGQIVRAGILQARFYRRDIQNESKNQTRAAFVVSRKTGKATVRNSVRRRLREIYRLSDWRGEARLAQTDLLIFAGNAALDASNDDLKKALNELLRRVAQNRRTQNNLSQSERTPKESSDVGAAAKKDGIVALRQARQSAVRRFTAHSTSPPLTKPLKSQTPTHDISSDVAEKSKSETDL